MREIKFRAWDKARKKMFYDDSFWFPFFNQQFPPEPSASNCYPITVTSKGILFCRKLKENCEVSVSIKGKTTQAYTNWEEDAISTLNIILMQYTGLKDKNGREIDWWEDDLLQSLGADKKVGQIKYDEQCAEWRLYVDGNSWCSLAAAYYDGWQKIGDIHSTPNLLEKQE